jgi:hypothetical protein
VPIREGRARMKLASEMPLRFRGPIAAVVRATRSGDQAIGVSVSSRPGAGCVNRYRLTNHKVPRSRASFGRQPLGLARPSLSSGSSARADGVCRCRSGLAARSRHLSRLATFRANPTALPGLYGSVSSAYGRPIMRQPNYALQRTGNQPHFQFRPQRAAAERER